MTIDSINVRIITLLAEILWTRNTPAHDIHLNQSKLGTLAMNGREMK